MDKQMTASEINKILSGRPFHYKWKQQVKL
jgi:hypothetical protein